MVSTYTAGSFHHYRGPPPSRREALGCTSRREALGVTNRDNVPPSDKVTMVKCLPYRANGKEGKMKKETENKKVAEKENKELPVGEAEVAEALEDLQKYKRAKATLEDRIIRNEEWWKMRYTDLEGEMKNSSAWLFNSIASKHADAMDNIPEPCILPREKSDGAAASMLSSVVPCVLEQNGFEKVYSSLWYDKLKYGTGCYGVFWNPRLAGGLGDVEITTVNLLNLFWEGGIGDIQKSRNIFHVELWDNDILKEVYPELKDELSGSTFECSRFLYDDSVDTSDKSAVIDWYYKKNTGGRQVLHLCKFCEGKVLFASENEEGYEDGFYAHGKYPFFFDTLYPVQGTPSGFGYVDVMKGAQGQIDTLGESIMENAKMASTVRYFIRNDGSVNEEEFADWSLPLVHVQGSKLGEDSLRQIKVSPLDSLYVAVMNNKIEELKETSGNRDFSNGGTVGGITAASAIAALQEAGSKLSRDIIRQSYTVFSEVVQTVVELIREFYKVPRFFRIVGENEAFEYVSYSNRDIAKKSQGDVFGVSLGDRVPVFDIKVKAQKQSPFAKVSQNELAKEFFKMGFFRADMAKEALLCMSMMEFEGKDILMEKIRKNGAAFEGAKEATAMAAAAQTQNGGGSKNLFFSNLDGHGAVRSAARNQNGGSL